MEKWAERIEGRMQERGVSDAALARAIKVSQPTVWQWFNAKEGKRSTLMIRGDNLLGVSRFLDLSPEWILTGRGPKELSHYLGLNPHKLEVAIVSVRKATEEMGLELDEKDAGGLISLAYRELAPYSDTLTKAEMQAFDGFLKHRLMEYSDDRQARPAAGTGKGGIEADAPAAAKARGRGRPRSR